MKQNWFAALPNLITIARILMTPGIVILTNNRQWGAALALFVVAGLSDAVDGWLAKTFHLESALGAMLDPIADKALIICIFVTLTQLGLAPQWLTILILGRDSLILVGVGASWLTARPIPLRPHFSSKATTAAQIALAALLLLRAAYARDFEVFYELLVGLTAALTVASGCVYLWLWSKHVRPQDVAAGSAVARRAQ